MFKINTLITSRFGLDGGAMFGIIPKPLWEKTNPADSKNRIELVTRSVLIQTEKKKILIDTGMGDHWTEKQKQIYNVDLTDNLQSELLKLGLAENDITDVILTHLHFDHTGGTTYLEDDEYKPRFKNAMHYCTQMQWNWANNPSEKDRGSFITNTFLPLLESKQLTLFDPKSAYPIEGFDGVISHGHTPGMWLPLIRHKDRTYVYCADLIPTSTHLKLPYIMAYDVEPTISLEEKKQFLELAAMKKWILIFEHDCKITAARIKKENKQFLISEIINL